MKALLLILAAILALPSITTAQPSQAGNAAEVQDYINKANRGEAGVNPKDQTAARSGDPYAQARIQQRLANNTISAQLAAGTITPQQAEARRTAASADYQRRVQAIEQEKILAELRRQNEELRRIRQNQEAARTARSYRQPYNPTPR